MGFVLDIRDGKLLLPEHPIMVLEYDEGERYQTFLVSVYMPLIGSRVSCIILFDRVAGEMTEFFPSDFQVVQPVNLEECRRVDFEWVEGSELAYM